MKKVIFFFLISLMIIAGIFCSRGMMVVGSDCMAHGDTHTAWCSNFLEHGTIMSGAILATLVIFFVVTLSLLTRTFFTILHIYFKDQSKRLFHPRDSIPIFSPVQMAIFRGVIHPRIP